MSRTAKFCRNYTTRRSRGLLNDNCIILKERSNVVKAAMPGKKKNGRMKKDM